MRSISATSAAAAAAGDIASATSPRAGGRDLPAEVRVELEQRAIPHLPETDIALLRSQVADAQHRAVAIPVGDEAVDERARRVEPARAVPGFVHEVGERLHLVADLGREREHRLLDISEVLVEGRGRSADLPGDVDDAQVTDAVGLEQRAGRVEQAAPGLDAALAERSPVQRLDLIHERAAYAAI